MELSINLPIKSNDVIWKNLSNYLSIKSSCLSHDMVIIIFINLNSTRDMQLKVTLASQHDKTREYTKYAASV